MSKNYDYEARSHFSSSDKGNLYHYGAGAHVNLNVSGDRFTGYDYSSGSHFTGTVKGGRVQLYDYGEGKHFNYSL